MRSCPYPGGLLPTLNSTTKCWQGEVLSSACHEQAEVTQKGASVTYTKPEIRVLGDATCIISGTKVGQTEPAYPYLDRQSPADSELDD